MTCSCVTYSKGIAACAMIGTTPAQQAAAHPLFSLLFSGQQGCLWLPLPSWPWAIPAISDLAAWADVSWTNAPPTMSDDATANVIRQRAVQKTMHHLKQKSEALSTIHGQTSISVAQAA